MKDIRTVLKEVKDLIDSISDNTELARELLRVRSQFELAESEYWLTMDDLGGVDKDGKIWSRSGGFAFSDWEFEEELNELRNVIASRSTSAWPDSQDSVSLSYSRESDGFGLSITVKISGVEVGCTREDLKKEVEKEISKLNQEQSSQNFLLNAVYVLPEKYQDYKLVL